MKSSIFIFFILVSSALSGCISDGEQVSETGKWTSQKDDKLLKISDVGSIDLLDEISTVSSSEYNILKLKKDEFWYTYDNGGSTHEFRMVKK